MINKKFKMKKKGLVSSQLVTIILLLVGFVILMLVFPTLLNEDEVDRQVCHTSVILRGTLPDTFNLKDMPSLKCQTAKFCITDKILGKGDCEYEFGDSFYVTARVSKDKTEEDINKFVARELASCWNMMGKGEIQVFTRGLTTEKKCKICSRIAFDKDLKDDLGGKVEGLGDYLKTREVPNQDISYLEFLINKGNPEEYDSSKYDNFSTDQKAIVFIEVGTSKAWTWFFQVLEIPLLGGIGAKTGFMVGSLFAPVTGPIGPIVGTVVGGGAGIVFGWIEGNRAGKIMEGEEFFSGHAFIEHNPEDLKGLSCDSFEGSG